MSPSTNASILLAEGYESAFLGVGIRAGLPTVAVYSIPKAILMLQDQGMTKEEARVFLHEQAHQVDLGDHTPLWVEELTLDQLKFVVMATSEGIH